MSRLQPEAGWETVFDHAGLSEGARLRGSYQAFLLRCWLERMDGESAWRFTLVQLHGRQVRKGFAFLEDLMAYLENELDIPRGD